METKNYIEEDKRKKRRKRGFFFLLGVGVVAAIAIPLITVETCSSNKHADPIKPIKPKYVEPDKHIEYGNFTKEADEYRGLNIVSYSWKIPNFGWGVSVAKLNSAAKWYSPTEIKVAPDKVGAYAPSQQEKDLLYKELKKLRDQTNKKIDDAVISLVHRPIIDAIRKAIDTFWTNAVTGPTQLYAGDVDRWYANTCTAINTELDKVFKKFKNESDEYAKLEYVHSQGGFKPLAGVTLSKEEKDIYEFALPMLMKTAKTRAAVGAIAPAPNPATPITELKLYTYPSSTFKTYSDFQSLGDEFHKMNLYDEIKNGETIVKKSNSDIKWASASEIESAPLKSTEYKPSASEKIIVGKTLDSLYTKTLNKINSIPVTNMHPDQIEVVRDSIKAFYGKTFSNKSDFDSAYKTLVDETNAQAKIMFFDLKPAQTDKSEFEYLYSDGGFKNKGDQMDTGREKEILQEGIPLLMKVAKLKALINIL